MTLMGQIATQGLDSICGVSMEYLWSRWAKGRLWVGSKSAYECVDLCQVDSLIEMDSSVELEIKDSNIRHLHRGCQANS